MMNLYDVIQLRSLKDTEKLVVAHEDVQSIIETEPSPPPSRDTIPVPTSPTVPVAKRAA